MKPMDKNNRALYEALCEAQMPKAQARLIASQLRTQFATKQDIERLEWDMECLEHRLEQKINALTLKANENHASLIQWVQLAVLAGILVAFLG